MRALEVILPSVGVLLFFAIVLRAVFAADRSEREAARRYETRVPPASEKGIEDQSE